jgi:hypothetical protein
MGKASRRPGDDHSVRSRDRTDRPVPPAPGSSHRSEVVKKYGEISLAGVTFPSPSNQCWPEPVPYIFKHGAMQMLQQPDKITIVYNTTRITKSVGSA